MDGLGMITYFFFQAEDGIRDKLVTGVQTCALPIWMSDLGQLPTREGLVQLHAVPQSDPLTRGGARDEDGAPVCEPTHALPACSDRGDRHDVAHPPRASRRAARPQPDGRSGGRTDGAARGAAAG